MSEYTHRCKKCHGTNVQLAMWVYPNTNRVVDDFGSWGEYDVTWCDDCQDHTGLEMVNDDTGEVT